MKAKYFVDKEGNQLGGFVGVYVERKIIEDDVEKVVEEFQEPKVPEGALEVVDYPNNIHFWQKMDMKTAVIKKGKIISGDWLPLTQEQLSQIG